MRNTSTMPVDFEKATTPVGHATRDALKCGDSLTAWARNDRTRRTREARTISGLYDAHVAEVPR